MAFFLIGRGPENDVRLLSDSLFATRQDAMSELSQLSADSTYDQWDAEVYVADFDAAVPVLLVRPQVAPDTQSIAEEGGGDADAWIADLPQHAPALSEERAVESDEPLTVAPPEATPVTEPNDLRHAILRTMQHMNAEGIEPPASAGLDPAADVAQEPTEEPAPAQSDEPAWPWDARSADQVAEEAEPSAVEASVAPQASETGDSHGGADDSDFILDLGAIQTVALESADEAAGAATTQEAQPPAEAPAAVASMPLTEYTCDDCVYVVTCPNRDQRLPKDCGSFQWK